MTIWIDMTNTLVTWQGGVVGIVRSELQIAKNLKSIYPELRVSKFDGYDFVEVEDNEIRWLWDSENVTDGYLKAMGRFEEKPDATEEGDSTIKKQRQSLKVAYSFSTSRLKRFDEAWRLLVASTSLFMKPFLWILRAISTFLFSLVTLIRRPLNLWRTWKAKTRKVNVGKSKSIHEGTDIPQHPYKTGDKVFSMGWMGSGKEEAYSRIRSSDINFSLIYLVYDLILINRRTINLYDAHVVEMFRDYFEWCLINCDALLYLGENTQKDCEDYAIEHGFPILPGYAVYLGSNIQTNIESVDINDVRTRYGIKGRYILAVGTIEPRKNYETLYRAYSILAEDHPNKEYPDLVIVGSENAHGDESFAVADIIKEDPKTSDKAIIIQPDDSELMLLYKNSDFVVLPSLYEGASVVVAEALQSGSFIVASDVPPIREMGQDYIDYVAESDILNPRKWAEILWHYFENMGETRERTKRIENSYAPLSWHKSAELIFDVIESLEVDLSEHFVYYDATLILNQALADCAITGILRSDLMLLRHISRINRHMRYFAYNRQIQGCFIFDSYLLRNLLRDEDLDEAFVAFGLEVRQFVAKKFAELAKSEKAKSSRQTPNRDRGKREAFWMFCSTLPRGLQTAFIGWGMKTLQKYDVVDCEEEKATVKDSFIWPQQVEELTLPFKKGDVLFSAGIGGETAFYDALVTSRKEIGFKQIQAIYDLTPMLVPQTHSRVTIETFSRFVEFVSKTSDIILYGGRTAMRDGEEYLRAKGMRVPYGVPVRWGENIALGKAITKAREDEILEYFKKIGIEDRYVITVGTWQNRKNHTVLYNAYIRMIEQGLREEIPQLVIVGRPGWKTEHLIRQIQSDPRLEGKILLISPSDELLTLLYRDSLFSLLPSIYEGWSLTLPEALQYGKFCLAADVAPLREIGGDLIEYVHPYDTAGWADRILHYSTNADELRRKEKQIQEHWKSFSWNDCAQEVARHISRLIEE
jgi:glycosyltransferase involved in cell wall biosynthesis